jgi:hypothetical protein
LLANTRRLAEGRPPATLTVVTEDSKQAIWTGIL